MITRWIYIGILVLWTSKITETDGATCRSPEDCLYQDLFSNYNTNTRPRENPAETVDVAVDCDIEVLTDIDDINEVMNIVAIFHARWTDTFLKWNASEYNGTEHLLIPAERVWRPNLAILNSAEKFFEKSHREDFYVVLSSDGGVYWAYGGTFSTTCPIDISRYPFDSQSCSLQLFIWGYTSRYVTISGGGVDRSSFANNSLWELLETSSEMIQYLSGDDIYIGTEFTFHWKRKTMYYSFNMVLPIVLLLISSWGIFWLPVESGERVSLAITVLLSFSVFLIVIMENTPISSEKLPVISEFVILVMVSTTVALLESLCVVIITYQDKRPPKWLRRISSGGLARLFCLKDEIPDIPKENTEWKSKTQVKCQVKVTDLEDTTGSQHFKKSQHCSETELLKTMSALLKIQQDRILVELFSAEWKLIGKLLDRLMFIIVVVVTTCSAIAMFTR